MTVVTDLDLPTVDPNDPTLRGERFEAVMGELRDRAWLATSPLAYVVLDREAATFFLRTRTATFPGMEIAQLFGIDDGPLYEEMRRNILHLNGDDHRRLRNLVNPAFTPRAADRWRPVMRGFASDLFDRFAAAGRCDFVATFAKPYPAMTIATVVGAPVEDADRLWDWSTWIQRQFDAEGLMNERPRIEQAVVELYAYLDDLLAARRAAPREDLVSTLLALESAGDRLSDVECVNLVLNVLVGGVDTTQSQLAHAIRLFASHPDQWELLAADPSLAPRAVEEIVRLAPITPFTARIMLEDVEYRDVTFPKNTIVLVCTQTGNRDEVADPDAFDITADRGAAKPLTFGAGIHYCLGANLARAEMQEALAYLAPRMRSLRLEGEPVYGTPSGIYSLEALPIAFEAA